MPDMDEAISDKTEDIEREEIEIKNQKQENNAIVSDI